MTEFAHIFTSWWASLAPEQMAGAVVLIIFVLPAAWLFQRHHGWKALITDTPDDRRRLDAAAGWRIR